MCFLHFLVTYQGSLFRGSMSHNFAPQESSRVWKNANFELFCFDVVYISIPSIMGPSLKLSICCKIGSFLISSIPLNLIPSRTIIS